MGLVEFTRKNKTPNFFWISKIRVSDLYNQVTLIKLDQGWVTLISMSPLNIFHLDNP